MQPLNVLSLFDGMSCGRLALAEAGIPVSNYYAAEIDKFAIKVTQANFPDTVQLGTITDWQNWNLDWTSIDLILCGSPCQGLSVAGRGLGLEDPRSALFFDFCAILTHASRQNPNIHFLFENVVPPKKHREPLQEALEAAYPLDIDWDIRNSADFLPQSRKRLYAASYNLPPAIQPRTQNLIDLLEDGWVDRTTSHCIDANYHKGTDLQNYIQKHRRQLVLSDKPNPKRYYRFEEIDTATKGHLLQVGTTNPANNAQSNRVYSSTHTSPTIRCPNGGMSDPKIALDEVYYRILTPLECERLQGVPDDYTAQVSNTQRYRMLGNGWTVPVIAHLLSPLKD